MSHWVHAVSCRKGLLALTVFVIALAAGPVSSSGAAVPAPPPDAAPQRWANDLYPDWCLDSNDRGDVYGTRCSPLNSSHRYWVHFLHTPPSSWFDQQLQNLGSKRCLAATRGGARLYTNASCPSTGPTSELQRWYPNPFDSAYGKSWDFRNLGVTEKNVCLYMADPGAGATAYIGLTSCADNSNASTLWHPLSP
jgi:hypothetical protein